MLQQRLIDFKEHARTPAEEAFLKLQAQQEVLSNQLERLSDRRDNLAENLSERSTGADREGVEARIKLIDSQIQATEIELQSVTKDLASAATSSVADHVATRWMGYDEGQLVASGFAGAAIMFVLFIPLLYRTFKRRRWVPAGTTSMQTPAVGNERADRMEGAIDAIAVEVERISENQRFMTRLLTETQLAGTIAAVRGSTEAAKVAAENSHG